MSIDDELRRMKEASEAMSRALDPYSAIGNQIRTEMDIFRALGVDNTTKAAIDRLAEEQRKMQDITMSFRQLDGALGLRSFANEIEERQKLLQGIVPDYQRLGLLGAAYPLNDAVLAAKSLSEQFRMPDLSEFDRLSQEIATANEIAAGSFQASNDAIAEAMKSMQSPWLLRDDVLQSARAFAEMQQIGHAIGAAAPFDARLVEGLRGALGDWREVTTLPPAIFDNAIARTDFYVELGFNSSLTNFTAKAFDESSKLAGFLQGPDEDGGDEEEIGLVRTNRAHALLMRFERSVRRFVDFVMKTEFGDNWLQRQLPTGMLESWEQKRKSAIEKGEQEQPLINYADFTDYIRIIERKDNWDRVFKAIFIRQTDVQESFVRLFPVRICTMHARLITLDDEWLLRVETRRLSRAFSKFL